MSLPMSDSPNFEILSELGRTTRLTAMRARRTGDLADTAGRYVIKAFDFDALGLLEGAAAAQTFIERATLQKRLADQGTHHWAKVVEVGTPEDAYVVTEYYPLTAQKLIEQAAPIDVRGLYTVIWSVVRGLTELRETARRAHGNLKPNNVLIRGDARLVSPETTQVVLDDPSVEANSAKDRSADLLALGELIHRLVLKRPFREKKDEAAPASTQEASAWPVSYTAAWGRLGPGAERWLELCNWLLNPDARQRPADLVEVAVLLHELAPKPERKSRKWLVAAVVPVLLGLGGAGYFWKLHADARIQLSTVNQQWFGAFEKAIDDPQRVQRYSVDETLKTVVQQVRQAKQSGVPFDPAGSSVWSYGNYQKTRTGLGVVERVERELQPERWQRLAAMNAIRQRYESRGWSQPAAYLAELNRGVVPTPGTDLAAGIDRMMDITGRITDDAIWLDDEWLKYEADLKVVRDSGDPLLQAFARELRESLGKTLRLTDAGFDGLDGFKLRIPLAARLAKLVRDGFPKDHGRERIASDIDSQLNVANPTEADIRQWLAAIDDYSLVKLDPAAEPLVSLTTSFQKLTADVKRQSLSESEQSQYTLARTQLEQKLAGLTDARFVKKDVARAQGEISLRAGDVQRELDQLRKQWVRLDDPRQWIEFIDLPLASASDTLKLRWKAYVDSRRRQVDALARNAEAFKKAKADAELVRGVLSELDKQFPPVASGLQEPFLQAAWDRRERDLTALSAWSATADAAVPDLDKFALTVDDQGKRYIEWCETLRSLAKDFPIKRELLLPTDRPDQAWASKVPEFWKDPLVQKLLEKDLARINALAAVAKMSRQELISAGQTAEAIEIVLAAWRRLGEEASGAPAWPSTQSDLEVELSIRNRLAPMINGLTSEADRKTIAEEWRAQGPTRWRQFMSAAVLDATPNGAAQVEQRITTGQRFRNAMLVTDQEADKLAPAPRFNYALYIARISITDAADITVRAAALQLLKASVDLRDRPPIADLAQKLSRLGEQEPMAAEARLLAATPPAMFTLPIRDRYSLQFIRIEPPRRRPFYLCTTELSLGQFVEAINGTGNWAAANQLMGNLAIPGGAGPTALRGPRAWDRPSAGNASIDRFESWRFDTPSATAVEFQYATPLRQTRFNSKALKREAGDNPKYDHPMQQLTPQAALYVAAVLNCRLPTPQEWQAAYDMERKAAGDDAKIDANLRDITWRQQQQFTTTDVPSQWPSADVAGVFWPKEMDRPAAVGSRNTDDKTLFFRLVNTGGGTFQNIVGNVAEFVCDRDETFDALPDRRTPEGILRFAKDYASQIQVVGGSGLSAPELDVTRPYPVTGVAEAYADVGLRLAFTAPARTMAERMKYILDEQTFLATK